MGSWLCRLTEPGGAWLPCCAVPMSFPAPGQGDLTHATPCCLPLASLWAPGVTSCLCAQSATPSGKHVARQDTGHSAATIVTSHCPVPNLLCVSSPNSTFPSILRTPGPDLGCQGLSAFATTVLSHPCARSSQRHRMWDTSTVTVLSLRGLGQWVAAGARWTQKHGAGGYPCPSFSLTPQGGEWGGSPGDVGCSLGLCRSISRPGPGMAEVRWEPRGRRAGTLPQSPQSPQHLGENESPASCVGMSGQAKTSR